MEKMNALHQLISSYPKFEIVKYGIPKEKVSSLLYWELMNRGWSRISKITGINRTHLQYRLSNLYDKISAQLIDSSSDFFIGWSSCSELGLEKAKQSGTITILERGSAHIEVQTELLTEEYKLNYRKKNIYFTHPLIIEKELREYHAADFISVPSTFAKKSFISKGIKEEKIFLNPYGVNIDMFYPAQKRDKVFRVIYVGQMSLQKGVHYLLEAFHELKLKNAELQLIGAMTDEIKPFFEKFKGSYVFHGPKPQAELNKYYSQSSLFVICSIQDGMAMVIPQAMACGLPIICTTNTGAEDLILNGQEGFVIPIRDIEAIKQKITWMYEHPQEMVKMGIAASNKISQGYSWDDYGIRYHTFLQTLMMR